MCFDVIESRIDVKLKFDIEYNLFKDYYFRIIRLFKILRYENIKMEK